MPYRLVPLLWKSRDHTTCGLAFLASFSHTNSRKRGLGNVHGRGTGPRSWVEGGAYRGHGITRVDSDHVLLPSFGSEWTRWTLTQRGSWRQDTIHPSLCNSCESWKTNVWSHPCNTCIDRLWHYQQIWHESCWHQGRACSVLEGLWEGTYGCAGLCAERWEIPGTSVEQRVAWHWNDWSFTFQLVPSYKVNDNYWPSPNQLCYRRSYSEGILCNLHASQLPGRLFTEPTRLWVYHGKRMSRPKEMPS